MRESTNTNPLQEKPKRLIFAEEIRRRHRLQKLSQIRIDNGVRQKTWEILNRKQVDVNQLCEIIHDRKSNEAAVSLAISQWLREKRRTLLMNLECQSRGWVQIMCCVVEYDSSMVGVVLEYLGALVEQGEGRREMEGVFLLMCTIMNTIEFPKHSSSCNSKQTINEYAKEFIGRILPLYHLLPVGINQLKFYTRFMRIFPEDSHLLALNVSFLHRISQHLEAGLEQKSEIGEIFKILVYATYYDGQYYEGVTEELIQLGCLRHIGFFICFTHRLLPENAVCEGLFVVENIVKNVGVGCVLHTGIMADLISMISESSEIPSKLVQAYIQTYLSIVEQFGNSPEELEYIRSENVVEEVIGILSKYGEYREEVERNCYFAMLRILNIGEQLRLKKQVDINPYLLKLKYCNVTDLFAKFHLFEQLLTKFGDE